MWFVQDVFLKWSIWWNVPEKKTENKNFSFFRCYRELQMRHKTRGGAHLNYNQTETDNLSLSFSHAAYKTECFLYGSIILNLGQKYCAVAETNLCWSHAGKMCLFYQLKAGKQLLTVPLSQGGTTAGSSAWFARVHCHVSLMTQPR